MVSPSPEQKNREQMRIPSVKSKKMPNGSMARLSVLAGVCLALGTGCAAKVDSFTVNRVMARASAHPDLGAGCAMGESLGGALEALTKTSNPSRKALVMSNMASALCSEMDVREAQLDGARARHSLSGTAMVSEVKDAKIREARARRVTAMRYFEAFKLLEAEYGEVGAETCPKIKRDDEIVYLMGLYSGIASMLHDKASGGTVGATEDLLGKVERGTHCVEDADWWGVPGSFRAAAWATLARAPDGGDPWQLLEEAAESGESSGIRLARAVQVQIAANAGREDDVRVGVISYADSQANIEVNPAYALFDEYGRVVAQHESDLLWIAETGHRTPEFGTFPDDQEESTGPDSSGGADPFADDPFGDDPFAEPSGDEEPAEEADSEETTEQEKTP